MSFRLPLVLSIAWLGISSVTACGRVEHATAPEVASIDCRTQPAAYQRFLEKEVQLVVSAYSARDTADDQPTIDELRRYYDKFIACAKKNVATGSQFITVASETGALIKYLSLRKPFRVKAMEGAALRAYAASVKLNAELSKDLQAAERLR